MKSLNELARAIDVALNERYGYGPARPGSFGEYACRETAFAVRRALEWFPESTVEELAECAHAGWSKAARAFEGPACVTGPAKFGARYKLAATKYADLPEEEKDRVAARAALAALGGG